MDNSIASTNPPSCITHPLHQNFLLWCSNSHITQPDLPPIERQTGIHTLHTWHGSPKATAAAISSSSRLALAVNSMETTPGNSNFSVLPFLYIVQFHIQPTAWACELRYQGQNYICRPTASSAAPASVKRPTDHINMLPNYKPTPTSRLQCFFHYNKDDYHVSPGSNMSNRLCAYQKLPYHAGMATHYCASVPINKTA